MSLLGFWLLFFLAGTAAGAAQAGLLLVSAGRRPRPPSTVARLMIVGLVLVMGALRGHLGITVAGWLSGLIVMGAWCYRRLR